MNKFPLVAANQWQELIASLLDRELANPADRLSALSGIAFEYSKSYKDTYLAGMWLSEILRDLCWYQSLLEVVIHRRLEGPTWPWSSLSSPNSLGLKFGILGDEQNPSITAGLASYKIDLVSE